MRIIKGGAKGVTGSGDQRRWKGGRRAQVSWFTEEREEEEMKEGEGEGVSCACVCGTLSKRGR